MTQRPSPPHPPVAVLVSFSLLMTGLLGVLLLVACVSRTDQPVTGRSDPAAAQDGAGAAPEPSAERAVGGLTSVVAFDAEELAGAPARPVEVDSPAAKRLQSIHSTRFAHPPIDWNTEAYDERIEAGFKKPTDEPLSTFSVDVDTASYTNVRRFLRDATAPPPGAVRIEELVNYFRYPRRLESGDAPFAVDLEIFESPWRREHHLVRIALEGRELPKRDVPPRNLVFLVDVSGSMHGPDRLDLVKYGLSRLTESLRPIDRVSIVVYAGASGLVLPPTPGDEEDEIVGALERLQAGGSTAGADGIRLAYATARKHFDPDGINRVILATDGDFNVGVSNRSELVRLIERERESGVFLTVLGFGRGNLNDAGMEQLADHGNGQYAYVDTRAEARRVLVEQADATLVTIAKDVKVQVEFNPQTVQAYRLIGYENRRLEDQDFNDDTKDAGEIGAGHHVTALYEIVPVGARGGVVGGDVDPLKYQVPPELSEAAAKGEWLTVKLRYKAPDEDESRLLSAALAGRPARFESASENARFSTAVALFGMMLRDSEFKGSGSYRLVEKIARSALGEDQHGERREFVELVGLARRL